MESEINEQAPEMDMNQLMKVRREKLKELQEVGRDPFHITKYNRTHQSNEIKEDYDSLEGKDVSVAGRIMAKRIMGKASFCHIQDSLRKNPELCECK